MLYWAEGAKERNQLQFCNSDPAMARYLVDFLRECFALSDDEISIRCWLHADHLDEQARIEQYWLDALGLPQASLRRSIVNVYSKYSKRKRIGNLPYGTWDVEAARNAGLETIAVLTGGAYSEQE